MNSEHQQTAKPGPLCGLRVLDFSRVLSGPYATQVLADLGAEVIKIESLDKGDETRNFPPFKGPFSHYFIALNRGKKSLAIDLKSTRGAEIARELARTSDVLVENFRPGVMDKLGLGYEALAPENDRLIYCSITGFGEDSPLRDRPAFDIVAQALSGVMSINREAGSPPNRLGIPMGDMAGSVFAVFGILAALIERQTSGKGQRVDIAMLDGLIGLLGYLAQIVFVTGKTPEPLGTRHASIVPYGAYPTQDGYIIVACLSEQFWQNFARALDMNSLLTDQRFSDYTARLANREALEALVQQQMRGHPTEYWLERLEQFDVPNAPILDVSQALEQEHTAVRGLIDQATHPAAGEMKVLRTPIRFGGKPLRAGFPPPLLGEQSRQVLSEKLGLSDEEIAELISQSIVQTPSG